MKHFIVVVTGDYVRDAQRFNGDENCDNIHDSDDWSDIEGDVIVGAFSAVEEEIEKEKEKFSQFYPKFTLGFIEIVKEVQV